MPNFFRGFGLLNSLVIIPLSEHFALIGSYYPLPTFRRLDYITVQAINWITANSGAEYKYSSLQYSPLPWCRKFIPYLQLFKRMIDSNFSAIDVWGVYPFSSGAGKSKRVGYFTFAG